MEDLEQASDLPTRRQLLNRLQTLNEDCPICWTKLKTPVQLDCKHIFCRSCITQWFESDQPGADSCPKCRQQAWIELTSYEYLRRIMARAFGAAVRNFLYRHNNYTRWLLDYGLSASAAACVYAKTQDTGTLERAAVFAVQVALGGLSEEEQKEFGLEGKEVIIRAWNIDFPNRVVMFQWELRDRE